MAQTSHFIFVLDVGWQNSATKQYNIRAFYDLLTVLLEYVKPFLLIK